MPVEYRQEGNSWYAVNPKWGTSRGWFQVRILRDPMSGNAADRWRVGAELGDPLYNAKAAFAISKGGTDFSPWTIFRTGAYEQFLGQDYELKTGHPRANDWNL